MLSLPQFPDYEGCYLGSLRFLPNSHIQNTEIITDQFPNLKAAISLLEAMERDPLFTTGGTSEAMVQWIKRIEDADPNIPGLDEDETDYQWGHQQYTQGSLTNRSVLTSWAVVGDVPTACQLLAAAVKTSRVARKLCEVHGTLQPQRSYLSDSYLDSISEKLWGFWMEAHRVFFYRPYDGSFADPLSE